MSAKKRKLRTWSEFGEIHRRPTEYEIGTHAANYTMRKDRLAALEQNPSSPGNLWFLAYRDNSPLQLDDWEVFRIRTSSRTEPTWPNRLPRRRR
jgi:toluene monooxygenase system protein E